MQPKQKTVTTQRKTYLDTECGMAGGVAIAAAATADGAAAATGWGAGVLAAASSMRFGRISPISAFS